MTIKQIVNDSEWQTLRKSFLGTWKTSNGENVEALRTYLGDFSDPLKLRRVHNYLTGSGFRIGIISSFASEELLEEVRRVRWASSK
jgi:hypothetical protein